MFFNCVWGSLHPSREDETQLTMKVDVEEKDAVTMMNFGSIDLGDVEFEFYAGGDWGNIRAFTTGEKEASMIIK